MYRFSRAIYRELADEILEDPHSSFEYANHVRVLRACEAAVERLATDRHYFAHPSRTLFNDIRAYFPMNQQLRVLRVIERYLNFGLTKAELTSGKPIIGIAQSGSDLSPCNRHHLELAKRVREGIRDGVDDKKALGGKAALTRVLEARTDGGLHRTLQVGVFHANP